MQNLYIYIYHDILYNIIPTQYSMIRAQYNSFLHYKNILKTIILGSSHARHGFIPNFYSAYSFNLGVGSCDLIHCYYLLKKITNTQSRYYTPQLSEVILYFSYFHFYYNLYKSKRNFVPILLSTFFEIPKSYTVINEREVKKSFHLTPLYSDYIDTAMKHHGFISFSALYSEQKYDTQRYSNITLQSTQFEWLEKIAHLCKKLNLKFHIILPPYDKLLLSALPEQFETVITQQLEQVYHTKLFNFTNDASFTTKNFWDNDHLNILGAEKLTRKIKLLIENT